jgi:hypothetical protein
MRKIVKPVAALVAIFMVFAPLSASACDLSCWLNQTRSDCHSARSAAVENQGTMSGHPDMDMRSGAGMGSRVIQSDPNPDYGVSASAHHAMAAQMDLVRGSLQGLGKSGTSPSVGLDDSKTISPCSHETCRQASVSASPPSAGRANSAHLQCFEIHASNPADFLASYHRITSGMAPPATFAANLLPALRI